MLPDTPHEIPTNTARTIVVGLVNPYACLAVHGALAVYYALDPLSRWVSRFTE